MAKPETKKAGKKTPVKKYLTPVFRISYPHLFKAQPSDFGEPKFDCQAVWTPSKFTAEDKKRWKEIGTALNEASMKRFKKAWKDLPANIRRGIRDGEEREGQQGYGPGTKFATLSTTSRPGVVDNVRDESTGKYATISPDEGNSDRIYPGCYCQATVTVYSYDNKSKGVALGLSNLQFVKDGPRLDSRTKAEDDFDEDIDAEWMDQDEDVPADDNAGDGDDDADPFA